MFSNLFQNKPGADFKQLIAEGAQIVDVRTPQEYSTGHIPQSVNLPVQELADHLSKLDKSKPIITCCASGMRSGSALNLLKSHGYAQVYNGGSWSSLQKQL